MASSTLWLLVFGFLVYHVYLISKNQTQYQSSKTDYLSNTKGSNYVNIYNKSLFENWSEIIKKPKYLSFDGENVTKHVKNN